MKNRSYYRKIHAMMKMRPGARFGMAVPIAGEVRLIPLRNRDWNSVTLHTMIPTLYE